MQNILELELKILKEKEKLNFTGWLFNFSGSKLAPDVKKLNKLFDSFSKQQQQLLYWKFYHPIEFKKLLNKFQTQDYLNSVGFNQNIFQQHKQLIIEYFKKNNLIKPHVYTLVQISNFVYLVATSLEDTVEILRQSNKCENIKINKWLNKNELFIQEIFPKFPQIKEKKFVLNLGLGRIFIEQKNNQIKFKDTIIINEY